MGARDQYTTVTGVIQAFANQHNWQQAELARHLGIESRRLRTVLHNLQAWGMPLSSEVEHPHVYWSVPKSWFPGGVFFDQEDWDVLVQATLRVPEESRRKKMLGRLLNGRVLGTVELGIERLEKSIVGQPVTPLVQQATLLVQQAVLQGRALRMHYFSASSGKLTERLVSPQLLVTEPHPRLAAYCHNNQALRWFRLDNVQRVALDPEVPLFEVDVDDVTRFVAASPDGFHDGTETAWSFMVSPAACAWVKGNLLPGMHVEHEWSAGMRVTARGGALVVARFIVGLGGDAVADQDALKDLVRQLARDALAGHEE